MSKIDHESLYRSVSERMPSTCRSFKEDEQTLLWGMKLIKLAEEHGEPAVRKALDRHLSTLASEPQRYPKIGEQDG